MRNGPTLPTSACHVALATSPRRRAAQQLGTVDYIAPEIVLAGSGRRPGGPVRPRVRRLPLPHRGHLRTQVSPTPRCLLAHLQDVRELPRASAGLTPGLPVHVDEALLRALSKSPAERFPDCRSFTAAPAGRPLPVAALEERACHSAAPVPTGRTRRTRPRRRFSGAVAVVGLATIVAAGILLAVPGSPALDEVSPRTFGGTGRRAASRGPRDPVGRAAGGGHRLQQRHRWRLRPIRSRSFERTARAG